MNKKFLSIVLGTGLLAAGCSNGADNEEAENTTAPNKEASEQEHIEGNSNQDDFLVPFAGPLAHVHGMGYIEAEDGLYFATHNGLKIYQNGGWFETDGQFNDYMGFNAVDTGFYTSGHPGIDSDLPNPIGIQRSNDGGRTLESLGLEGETDFHWMAAGYRSHDLFVMNPQANSMMEAGFHLSDNKGEDWEQVKAQGLEGDLMALAIHPENSQLLAVASANGIYLSEDGGATFGLLTEKGEIGTAVHFTDDQLYYASHGSEAALNSYALEDGDSTLLELPELGEDGAVFIAVNPADDQEMAFYTVQGDAFVSSDGGASWDEIVNEGEIQ